MGPEDEFNPEVNFIINSVDTGEDDEMEEDPLVGYEEDEEEEYAKATLTRWLLTIHPLRPV